MNDYYYILKNFCEKDLQTVTQYYWEKIHPAHTTVKTNNLGKGQKISYFVLNSLLTPDIIKIMKKYPILTTHCLVNEEDLGSTTGIHTDGTPGRGRKCAINFPIVGCSPEIPTIFYGTMEDYPYDYYPDFNICRIKEGIVPIPAAEIAITNKPVLINTNAWHSVTNNATPKRITFSWTCKYHIDFYSAKQLLSKQGF